MKKHIVTTLLLTALTVLLTTSCGHLIKMQNPQKYSAHLENSRPLNIGKVQTTKHGVYHVQIYDRSVILMAMTKVITPSNIEVFDLDHDQTFDAVFVYQNGSWNFGATRHFREKYRTLHSTLDEESIVEYIDTATALKKTKRSQHTTVKTKTPNTTNGTMEKSPPNYKWVNPIIF